MRLLDNLLRRRRLNTLISSELGGLRAFARRLTRDPIAAEDLVQLAVERALPRLDQLQDEARFGAWMRTIVYRTWLNRRRERPDAWQHTFRDLDQHARTAALPGPERALQTRRLGVAIHDALERLQEPQRLVVWLIDVDGLSFSEAAEVLDVPMGTVASRLARGRRALRVDLADVASAAGVGA